MGKKERRRRREEVTNWKRRRRRHLEEEAWESRRKCRLVRSREEIEDFAVEEMMTDDEGGKEAGRG